MVDSFQIGSFCPHGNMESLNQDGSDLFLLHRKISWRAEYANAAFFFCTEFTENERIQIKFTLPSDRSQNH